MKSLLLFSPNTRKQDGLSYVHMSKRPQFLGFVSCKNIMPQLQMICYLHCNKILCQRKKVREFLISPWMFIVSRRNLAWEATSRLHKTRRHGLYQWFPRGSNTYSYNTWTSMMKFGYYVDLNQTKCWQLKG